MTEEIKHKLKIIVGSTRPTRLIEKVFPWVINSSKSHAGFEVEVLDLRDWNLPFFSEHFGTIGDINNPTYSEEIVRAWNNKIKEGDAFIFITPEYNHSIPGVLKNAIDSIWLSFGFRNKPIAMIGYSAGMGGGIRAIEHLIQIATEMEAVPMRASVVIPNGGEAFNAEGLPFDPVTSASINILLDDLAWWSAALKRARNEGELTPSRFRIRKVMDSLKSK